MSDDKALADSRSDKLEIDRLRADSDAKAAELAAMIKQLKLWQCEVTVAEVRAVAYATSNGAWSHAPCCSGSLGGPPCTHGPSCPCHGEHPKHPPARTFGNGPTRWLLQSRVRWIEKDNGAVFSTCVPSSSSWQVAVSVAADAYTSLPSCTVTCSWPG